VIAGRLEYAASSPMDLPVVGDYVEVTSTEPAVVIAVVPRKTLFTRVVNGERQPLAANVDVALLVCGLDRDFNVRRLERYVVLCREAGVRFVFVLNKSDLCADVEARIAEARAVAEGAPVVTLSALSEDVWQVLGALVNTGETAALLGSSGVGKSTMVNALLGSTRMAVGSVRESDSRGRHTTTGRELFALPEGWFLMDMPGLKEVGIGSAGVEEAFDDIAELAKTCRFR